MSISDATSVHEYYLVANTLVACATLLVYDIICTLDQEVAYVWTDPLRLSSGLFFLNRYLPLVDTFLSLNLEFSRNTPEDCLTYYTAVTWFIVSGIIISEAILLLRTYAIWERTLLIKLSLCFLAMLTFIPSIVITELEIRSLKYIPTPDIGCRLEGASPIIIVAYILLVISETVLVGLTVVRARRDLPTAPSPWVVQMYRDGIIFYLYLLVISIANIIVPIVAPALFANWLATPQRVIHSILCTRVLFLIFRQRKASLTNRIPLQPGVGGQLLTSLNDGDERTGVDLTIIIPTETVTGETEEDTLCQNNRRT